MKIFYKLAILIKTKPHYISGALFYFLLAVSLVEIFKLTWS
jgi:hypothetical protein